MRLRRRDLFVGIGGVSGGMVLAGRTLGLVEPEPSKEAIGGKVTVTEDLMREHGILRRALFVYSEVVARLRSKPSEVSRFRRRLPREETEGSIYFPRVEANTHRQTVRQDERQIRGY